MASQGYRDWLKAGRPYHLIRPSAAVQRTLRGYGLTVYDYPNDAHLQASTPEDHTPFSVTGWPGANKRWNARALDVMPRDGSDAARKENADIARQLIRDRDAGVPGAMWIKYLNWTDERGSCQQERWTDSANPLRRTTRSSSDRGHIHISGRSDVDDDERADHYDPIARMHGSVAAEEDDMANTWTFQPDDDEWRLTQGTEGYAGQARDTALAFAWQNAAEAKANTDKLLAAATADETRDKATLAAITALTAGAGGSIDAAPILSAIADARAETLTYVQQLQHDLAAERAETAKLRARLAAAFGPGSE
jgi:hypothetical protein